MPKYEVTITESGYKTYEIEADSPKQAENLVLYDEGILKHSKTLDYDVDTRILKEETKC